MIIEDTINEITDFLRKLLFTLKSLLFNPSKIFAERELHAEVNLLKPIPFFLISYLTYLIYVTSLIKDREVNSVNTLSRILSNIQVESKDISGLQNVLYLILTFLVVYTFIIVMVRLLSVESHSQKNFKDLIFYFVGLNLFIYVFSSALWVLFYGKLSILLINQRIVTIDQRIDINHIFYRFHSIVIYLVVPSIYLLTVTKSFFYKRSLYWKYCLAITFVIFSVDLISHTSDYIRYLLNSETNSVVIKGSIKPDNSENFSYGYASPFFKKDSISGNLNVKVDLYFCNNTDSLLIIPKNDSLFIRIPTSEEVKVINSNVVPDWENWSRFRADSCVILIAKEFEGKSDRYLTIKPGELKWVTFEQNFPNNANKIEIFFSNVNSKIIRCRVFKPAINDWFYSQYWISKSLTQSLTFDYPHTDKFPSGN